MNIIRDIFRGLGRLPDAGTHPAIGVCLALVLVAGLLGWNEGGSAMALNAAGVALLFLGPILAIGALGRARVSDRVFGKHRR